MQIKNMVQARSSESFLQSLDLIAFYSRIQFDDCWMWNGSTYANGYGKYGRAGYMAHRLSYELSKRLLAKDEFLDHLCRNRQCVNPNHLEIVTLVENVMRGNSQHAINARKTHCMHGHEFTSDNTYIHPKRGTRNCKVCQREQGRLKPKKDKYITKYT
jgi:hypothetical protein